ncbi:MAG: energy transducer TonB [Actinobacillus minor]|nr:energy transducer TonB [Actinobacillus minor]
MNKRNSRIGLVGSIAIHGAIIGSVWAAMTQLPQEPIIEQEVTSISMEMLAGVEQQAQVAVAPEEIPVQPEIEEKETPTAVEEPQKPLKVEPIAEKPKEKKEKPKEKKPEPPKEKPKKVEKNIEKPKVEKPKPIEKPKQVTEKPAKPIKALEKGIEAKEGVVAKAAPNLPQAAKAQPGIAQGSPAGKGNVGSSAGSDNGNAPKNTASGNEINAYKVTLQRALQRRANNTYPAREKMMRKTGTVTLSFSVSSSGQVTNVQVINSSGNSNLDAAAVKAAQGTKTDAPPAGFPSNVTVPVRFSIE